jgi:uncharacterized protein YneF (UPF0154 family)
MKEQFKIKTIRTKISLFVFASVTVGIVIATFIVSMVIENQLDNNYEISKTAAIESLSNSLTGPLKLYDYNQIERIINSALIYQSVAYVSVNKIDGGLIVSATEQGVSTQSLEIIRSALTSEGYIIGSFDVGFSRAYIDNQIRITTGALTLGLMGFLLLMGFSLFLSSTARLPTL